MATEALFHTSALLTGDLLGDHAEVLHVVAGRRLMALRAVPGAGRGMAKLGEAPGAGAVTGGAVSAEHFPVPVLGGVTAEAVERGFGGADLRMPLTGSVSLAPAHPRGQSARCRAALRIGVAGPPQLLHAQSGERPVIHLAGPPLPAQVLRVAWAALPDLRVKGGGLTLQQRLIRSMAAHALRRVDSLHGRVAGGTISLQGGVDRRQPPGTGELLPRLCPAPGSSRGQGRYCSHCQQQRGDRPHPPGRNPACLRPPHENHRRPK